jgi:hypothetical protein
MSFAGSVVQLPRDRVASDLGEIIHGAAFRQILPDQSVGIFDDSALIEGFRLKKQDFPLPSPPYGIRGPFSQ